ncbi:MAG: PIN domain-containing protein [Firmicutes bacterium]|nr:PIN domain-containing protein [Bacillota bacterium]
MVLLIDTNIIIDVLEKRSEHFDHSKRIFELCEIKRVEGHLSTLSIANLIYVLRKELTPELTEKVILLLNRIFTVDDLKASDMIAASKMQARDYEDAIQEATAKRIKADYIITRNQKDFSGCRVPAITPKRLLEMLENN